MIYYRQKRKGVKKMKDLTIGEIITIAMAIERSIKEFEKLNLPYFIKEVEKLKYSQDKLNEYKIN